MNFTLKELITSETARKRGIDNTPSFSQVLVLYNFVIVCLQPIRNMWGAPITITSGYRSPLLNKAVGGVDGSCHQCLLGFAAADITVGSIADNKRLFDMIRESSIPFVELIWEQGGRWIHIAWHADRNDRQILYT